jgi:hypothetical protein
MSNSFTVEYADFVGGGHVELVAVDPGTTLASFLLGVGLANPEKHLVFVN